MIDLRLVAKAGADWGVTNHGRFTYSEGGDRMSQLLTPYPDAVTTDCSGFCTYLQAWTGTGYTAGADTQTFLDNYPHIAPLDALVSDAVVYGANLPVGDQHMAWLVESGASSNGNPMTVGNGYQGAPAYVSAVEGNPRAGEATITYLRLPMTLAVAAPAFPPGMLTVPGSPASMVLQSRRPSASAPPTLAYGAPRSSWLIYLRYCLEAAKCGPVAGKFVPSPAPGGYGVLTRAAVKRFEMRNGMAPDGIATTRVWTALGVLG